MGVKISELGAAGALDGTEVFPIVQSGSTVKTNIEAGAVLSFETLGTHYFPDWVGTKQTNDQLRCVAKWSEIPKQGTNIVVTLPSLSLNAVDGAGVSVTISGSHTISYFAIDGKHVIFYINETGVFATLNNGLIGLKVSGTGCKLTII